MTKIVNATPHAIKVLKGKEFIKDIVTFDKSEFLARVNIIEVPLHGFDGFECVTTLAGEVEGLPSEENGIVYIVSAMVLDANKKSKNPRTDLVAPNTGSTAVRNEKGHIEYVLGFVK